MSLPNCLRSKNAARRRAREREKAKAEFLAKLEEKYKKAIENSSNKELVAKYKEMIAIKELYEKEANFKALLGHFQNCLNIFLCKLNFYLVLLKKRFE